MNTKDAFAVNRVAFLLYELYFTLSSNFSQGFAIAAFIAWKLTAAMQQ